MPNPSPSSQGPFNPTGVTTFWIGNGAQVAQLDTLTVTAVVVGGTLTATINGKSVSYTVVTGDTTATAASAWQALLSAPGVPPELGEITFAVTNNILTATGPAAGTPFTLAATVGGTPGSALSHSVVPGQSPSDVSNPVNWIRNGLFQTPQDGDDVVVADSSVPLLYNLGYFVAAGVRFNSFTRWQSYTGTVGLPENNPAGYYEYRPTYFQMTGPTGASLPVRLGQGTTGGGPSRERYDMGTQQAVVDAVAAGSAQDDYAIRLLGSSPNNVVRVGATSVGIAMLPGESASLNDGTLVGPGGTLALGPNVSVFANATVTCQGGTLYVACPGGYALTVRAGGALAVEDVTGTQKSVTAQGGSRVAWAAQVNVTTLTLQGGSSFDKSGDPRAMTVTNATVDADCQVNDPYNSITWTNPVTVRDAIQGGVFLTGPGRSVRLS